MKKYVIYNWREKTFVKSITITNDGIRFEYDEDVRNAVDLKDKHRAYVMIQFIQMNGGIGFKVWEYGEVDDEIQNVR